MKCKHCEKPIIVTDGGELVHKNWPFYMHCVNEKDILPRKSAIESGVVVWQEEPVPHFTGPLSESQQICGDFDT